MACGLVSGELLIAGGRASHLWVAPSPRLEGPEQHKGGEVNTMQASKDLFFLFALGCGYNVAGCLRSYLDFPKLINYNMGL